MLRSLVALAEREGLVDDPAFEEKPVDFEVRIDAEGRYQSLISLRDEKGRGKRMAVPRLPKRTVAVNPGLLVDNAKYVLGIGDPDKDRPERLAACCQAFLARLGDALQVSGDPALLAAHRFCSNLAEYRAALLKDRPAGEWTGSELVVISVAGHGYVHERPEVRRACSQLVSSPQSSSGAKGKKAASARARCLVTGRVAAPARLHPPIKRVPGGQTSGTSLVSFNADAFRSHGLEQGDNAPVSKEAAIAYATALNSLLERDEARGRRYRSGVALGSDTVAVYWTSAPAATLDFFADLWEGPRPEEQEAFFAAPWKGEPPPELDEESFYVAILGGNAARLVVRDWFETTLGNLKAALHRYYDDLTIAGEKRPFAIWELVTAVDPPGRTGPPPELASRLFASAIRGTPLPRELLRHALLRLRVPADARRIDAARVALIKASLRGIGRSHSTRAYLKEISMALDEDSPQPAYQLGRLFAALERAQQNALGGDLNATIRDRYFAAASSTPASVFPRLIRLAQHHISKARAENREFGVERLIGDIVDHLPAAVFPRVMSLEEQGLFAVGYYHQREAFFASRKETPVE